MRRKLIFIILAILTASFCYSQTKFKKIQLNNEWGLWLNESSVDLVYKKYLDFNKLQSDFNLLDLNYKINLVDLEIIKDELKFKENNFSILVEKLEEKIKLQEEFNKAQLKVFKRKRSKNLFFGIGLGMIGGFLISK